MSSLDLPALEDTELDISVPGYLTIDPVTGAIGANFSGTIEALGLSLPEGTLATPPDTNRVRWVDNPSTIGSPERAYILGTNFRGVDYTEYELKLATQDGAGNDDVLLELIKTVKINGTTYSIYGTVGSAQSVGYLSADAAGNLLVAPVLAVAPRGLSTFNTGQARYFGKIPQANFPPTLAPVEGDRVDVAVSNPGIGTVIWSFVYDAASGYWYFVGGPAIQLPYADANAAVNTFTNIGNFAGTPTYVDAAQQITVPFQGDYNLDGFIFLQTTVAATVGAIAQKNNGISGNNSYLTELAAGFNGSYGTTVVAGCLAGDKIGFGAACSQAAATLRWARGNVTPIRIHS